MKYASADALNKQGPKSCVTTIRLDKVKVIEATVPNDEVFLERTPKIAQQVLMLKLLGSINLVRMVREALVTVTEPVRSMCGGELY